MTKIGKIFLFLIFALQSLCEAKIYDCFLFFNELEILDVRLHELYDHVDQFVLVESKETFRGKPKALFYQDNKGRYEKFLKKIIHVVVEEHFETSSPWFREGFQRNQIMRGLINCEPEDVILVSDVDEIVRASDLNRVLEGLKEHFIVGCEQPLYRYFFNCLEDDHWKGTCATTFGHLSTISPEILRNTRHTNKTIYKSGWHFTSMGGLQYLIQKLESFSHQEFDHEFYKTQETIEKHVKEKCQIVPLDETYPHYIFKNQDHFKSLGYIRPY